MRTLSLSIITIAMLCVAIHQSPAAVVKTKYGAIEGNVIVRQFDDLVVTIKTKDQRLFQYYARDVVSVTASTKILAGTAVFLREEPSDSAVPTIELATGCQVDFTKDEPQGDWVKVKTWGDNVGWIQHQILTDSVQFRKSPSTGIPPSQQLDLQNDPPSAIKE
ncbi:MAG: SH3 domain-containing protein [Candidatus Hinthialibacter antarcticus]|nr:SH3 domain-containing protein [Candidatus Hinthialibacter antarcticus]